MNSFCEPIQYLSRLEEPLSTFSALRKMNFLNTDCESDTDNENNTRDVEETNLLSDDNRKEKG